MDFYIDFFIRGVSKDSEFNNFYIISLEIIFFSTKMSKKTCNIVYLSLSGKLFFILSALLKCFIIPRIPIIYIIKIKNFLNLPSKCSPPI